MMDKKKLMEYMRKAVACKNENHTTCLGRNCCDCPHDYPVETIDLIESALEFLERYDRFWEEVKAAGMKGKKRRYITAEGFSESERLHNEQIQSMGEA